MRRLSLVAAVALVVGLLAGIVGARPASASTFGPSKTFLEISDSTFTNDITTAHYGQQVLFVVRVFDHSTDCTLQVGSCNVPQGTVELHDGDVNNTPAFQSVNLVADPNSDNSASAFIRYAGLAPGSHSISAKYVAPVVGNKFDPSASDPSPLTITQDGTTTALAQSSTTNVFGQGVDYTATVTPNDAPDTAHGALKPGGQVQFFDGINTLGTVNLDSNTGKATYHDTTLAVGVHNSLSARYAGDTNYSASLSYPNLSHTVTQGGSTSTLTSSASSVVFGQPYTVTDTVAAVSPATGTPVGSVTISDALSGVTTTTPLANGSVTLSLPNGALGKAVGVHQFSSSYPGDSNFTGSTSNTLSVTVNKANTQTALTTSGSPSTGGQGVTFTATVSVVSPGAGAATGTVQFMDGAANLGAPQPVNGSGVATFITSVLAPGSHSITAVYSGDANFNGSTSSPVSQTVTCDRVVSGSAAGFTASSGSTCVSGGTVSGTINVPAGAQVFLLNSTVTGALNASNARSISVCGSTIYGSTTIVSDSGGFVLIGDPVDAGCAANTINGNLLLQNNHGGLELGGNRIGGTVTLSGNSGGGALPKNVAPVVESNTIGGGLNCSGDSPAASDNNHSNTVSGARTGECNRPGF